MQPLPMLFSLPMLFAIQHLSVSRGRSQGAEGSRVPRETRVLLPPVFAEQLRRAQLSQFSLMHSPLLPLTFFHDVVFIKKSGEFAHYTGQKKSHFAVCQKCSVTQKYVKMRFCPRTSLAKLTTLFHTP